MKFNEQFEIVKPITFLHDYLRSKGITDVKEYIEPDGKYLEKSSGYANIEKGAKCLEKYTGEHFMIVVDCDADGFCSSAIMIDFCVNYLNMIPHILLHTGKQHGLSKDIMPQIKQITNCALLIIPDAGSDDTEQCKELKNTTDIEDILILDHHKMIDENHHAIVINNQSKNNVGIENTHLSGAGVTFKLIEYFCEHMGYEKPFYADLVAVSIISDVCDLSNQENRVFIYYGLQNVTNECLNQLWMRLTENELTPTSVAWDIAPKINALCRFEEQETKMKLIKAMSNLESDVKYADLVDKLKSLHSKQSRIVTETVDKYRHLYDINDKIIIIEDNESEKNMSGVIANKIVGTTNKPVLFVHKSDDVYRGSARSPSYIPLNTLLNESNLFEFNRGHEHAFGTSFKESKLEDIKKFAKGLDISDETMYNVVKVYDINENSIPHDLFTVGEEYEDMWGKGVEYPVFAIKNIKINGKDIKELGKRKMTIKFFHKGYEFIQFRVSQDVREKQMFVGKDQDIECTIIAKLKTNTWNGNTKNQIHIQEFEARKISRKERMFGI